MVFLITFLPFYLIFFFFEINNSNFFLAIICDFGLAKISSATLAVASKLSAQIGLSPRYAAPEVFSKVRTGTFSHDPV